MHRLGCGRVQTDLHSPIFCDYEHATPPFCTCKCMCTGADTNTRTHRCTDENKDAWTQTLVHANANEFKYVCIVNMGGRTVEMCPYVDKL